MRKQCNYQFTILESYPMKNHSHEQKRITRIQPISVYESIFQVGVKSTDNPLLVAKIDIGVDIRFKILVN